MVNIKQLYERRLTIGVYFFTFDFGLDLSDLGDEWVLSKPTSLSEKRWLKLLGSAFSICVEVPDCVLPPPSIGFNLVDVILGGSLSSDIVSV